MIAIILEGGLVREVRSDDDVEYVVLDGDTEGADEGDVCEVGGREFFRPVLRESEALGPGDRAGIAFALAAGTECARPGYDPGDFGEHPYFDRGMWREDVASHATCLGYAEWVKRNLGLVWEDIGNGAEEMGEALRKLGVQ